MRHKIYDGCMTEEVKQTLISVEELRFSVAISDRFETVAYTTECAKLGLLETLRPFIALKVDECAERVTASIHLPYVCDAVLRNVRREDANKMHVIIQLDRDKYALQEELNWLRQPWWKRLFKSKPR